MPDLAGSLHLDAVIPGVVLGVLATVAAAATRRLWLALLAATVAMAAPIAMATSGRLHDPPSVASAVASTAVAFLGGVGLATLWRTYRPAESGPGAVWLTPVVVWLTAVGIWLAVPDTEGAVAALAALTPLVLAAVARPPGWLRRSAAPLVVWMVVGVPLTWSAAWGARVRVESLPGALACFGIALAVPLIWAARGRIDSRLVVIIHGVTVVAAARWASRTADMDVAVFRTAAVLGVMAVALGVALAVSGRQPGQERPPPSDPLARRR